MIIGLTGGLASGKSTVSKFLQELGAQVINTDSINHQLLAKGKPGWRKVLKVFGKYILNENKEIDKGKLGKIVFDNPSKRKKLEALMHPLITNQVRKIIKKSEAQYIVLEIPLLYEAGMEELVDQVWVVYVDKKTQIKRAKKRNKLMNEKQIKKRINSQISLEEKRKRADIVIKNEENLNQLKSKIKDIWRNLNEENSFNSS